MSDYRGILVDVSQKNKAIFKELDILSQKEDGDWILYKVSVSEENMEEALKSLQDNLMEGFYFHFYRNKELIAVFKKKIFRVSTDESTWKEIIEYGKSLNIPEEQLDFYPCRIEDEKY